MKLWLDRPRDESYLLNPAFCSTTLALSVRGYTAVKSDGCPLLLSYMFLPILLHKSTRTALPTTTRTSLAVWLQTNAQLRFQFFERLMALKPFTREALLFGFAMNTLAILDNGYISITDRAPNIAKVRRVLKLDARECAVTAQFVGRWFAKAGKPSTVLALWGVRP